MAEESWAGHRLDDSGGARVGTIVGLIAGAEGEPGWLRARLGRLGRFTAVPAGDAVQGAGCVWVPYRRDLIRAAPRIESKGELDAGAERALREHYGTA